MQNTVGILQLASVVLQCAWLLNIQLAECCERADGNRISELPCAQSPWGRISQAVLPVNLSVSRSAAHLHESLRQRTSYLIYVICLCQRTQMRSPASNLAVYSNQPIGEIL